jgi:hypothetical protein
MCTPDVRRVKKCEAVMSDTVPPRGRSYFDFQAPAGESYKVDVESFDFTMGHGSN